MLCSAPLFSFTERSAGGWTRLFGKMSGCDQPEGVWPKGSKIAGHDKKGDKPRRIPFPSASDPKKLMPIRCPLPDHDKHSGMPLRFGIGPAQDRELEKKLLENMRLADIDKLVQDAGPDKPALGQDIMSARGKDRSGGGELQPRPPDKPKRTSSGSSGAAGGGEMSLMTAMAGRLRSAEETASALRDELKKRDTTIAELRAKLIRSEGMEFVRASSSSPGVPGDCHNSDADLRLVKDHNAKLRELLRKADSEK